MALLYKPGTASDFAIAVRVTGQVSGSGREMLARTVSSLVLSSILIACLYFGRPFFHLLVFGAAGLMAWEWARLCGRGAVGAGGAAVLLGCLVVVVLATFKVNGGASLALILAALTAALIGRQKTFGESAWLGAGVIYVGGGAWAAIALYDQFQNGVWVVVWVFCVVAFTDIGAFLAGRVLGGPKLAPHVSPRKTWSGFFGGLSCAALSGLVFALAADRDAVGFHIAAALVVSLVAQVGDLFESLLKRRFEAKDSSSLIPGHGGFLDRADGLISAMIVVALLAWWRGGVETPWI
ncbi:MAG: phosphatidate cytidylyltransferase [Rhodospirillaceae bacterium]|nr:phosphatidate cytidylyltransferase [Rhodospirillaceae bacterium]MCY4238065.1 phosphatidate cytidylyltransferase [Rhodospirillaceae bacterium]